MSRVNTIIGQLQDRLTMRFNTPKTIDNEGILSGGPGFLNQYPPDDENDVDSAETVDTPYTTNMPFILPTSGGGDKRGVKNVCKSKLKEQEDEDNPLADAPDTTPETGEDVAPEVGGGLGGANTGIGGDMGMGGGFGLEQEEPKTAGQLGRIYELKKIYSRLTSIESYLGNESSTELLEIRNLVSKSIELFEIVSANFDSYKEKLDEIIVMYYKFILEVYKEVESYFKKEASSGD